MPKGPEAFRTISEASGELGVAPHVLRFWETKFPFIRPMKRAGGRRFYRPADLVLLAEVRRLLREEGLSIAVVRRLHHAGGWRALDGVRTSERREPDRSTAAPRPSVPHGADATRERLFGALKELQEAKARLDTLLPSR